MRLLIELAIHRIPHLDSREKLILHGMSPDETAFRRLGSGGLRRLGLGRPRGGKTYDPGQALDGARADARWLEDPGHLYLPLWSPAYPRLLRQIYDPPFILFARCAPAFADHIRSGRLFTAPALAVVGTRRPSAPGELWARQLSADLCDMGFTVVSGLARGIDAMAHGGAVAARGITAAVLGHGPDRIYPSMNARLARDMLATGGCLISEYPPGTPPSAFRFPQRNRIIAGLSAGVLVAEAPEKSGALITADFALEQGREVMVIAPLLASRLNAGGRSLREAGAPAVSDAAGIPPLLSPGLLFPDEECRS
jgi:DNA processing protein